MSRGKTRAGTGAHTLFGSRVDHSLGGNLPRIHKPAEAVLLHRHLSQLLRIALESL